MELPNTYYNYSTETVQCVTPPIGAFTLFCLFFFYSPNSLLEKDHFLTFVALGFLSFSIG